MSINSDNDQVRCRMFAMLAFKNTPIERQKEIMKQKIKPNGDGSKDAFLYGFNPWEQLILYDAKLVYTSEGTKQGLLVNATFPNQIGTRTAKDDTVTPLNTLSVLISVEEGEPPYIKDLKPTDNQ